MSNGFTGISFPFRLNNKGGLKMSSTSAIDSSHIDESIHQILGTELGERVMELYFGSHLSTHVFDSHDEASYNLIRYEIKEALETFEPRIKVSDSDIRISEQPNNLGSNTLIVEIDYRVIKHNSDHKVTVEIGG